MATARRFDWPQFAALTVVVAAVLAILVWVEPGKAEAWIALAPGILGIAGMAFSMSRGRATTPPAPKAPRGES